MTVQEIPNVDFTQIPERLQGKWVVVRVGAARQEIIAEGESPGEAMNKSGVSRDDLTAILTKVPVPTAVAYMGTSKIDEE